MKEEQQLLQDSFMAVGVKKEKRWRRKRKAQKYKQSKG